MVEWFMTPVLKTGFRGTGTWVQIPLSPLRAGRVAGITADCKSATLETPKVRVLLRPLICEDVAERLKAFAPKAKGLKRPAGSNPAVFVLLQIRSGQEAAWKAVGRLSAACRFEPCLQRC